MKKVALILLSSMFVSSVFAEELSPKGTKIRLDLPVGSKHEITTDMMITNFTDASLSEEVAKVNTSIKSSYEILEKSAEGVHTVKATIMAIKANTSAQGMEINYDSEDPETAQGMGAMIAQQFAPILNKPVTFKVNNLGEVVEKPEASEDNGTMILQNMIDNLFMKMPEQEVSKGDTWEDTQSSGMGASMTMSFKVEEISKNEITLSYTADSDDLKLDEEAQGEDIKLEMGGKVIFNRKTGKLVSNNLSQTMSGSSPEQGEFFTVSTLKQSTN